MDAERWWPPFVELAAIAWIALFVVDLAVGADLLVVSGRTEKAIRGALQWLLVVFLLDLALLYRWSDSGPAEFVRSNWLLVLTAVPWFRPFRLLRAGRSIRALRILTGSRRIGSLLAKLRRKCRSLWRRLRD
ncbi:hypothetical protein [Halorubrum depositum]|uniref:hypothetical protein n=1 Tax=Halorubrum depositum TaxID=2583992 RepID=UPI00119E57F1|nr:hypothetical protein [Halorubrum depositum]